MTSAVAANSAGTASLLKHRPLLAPPAQQRPDRRPGSPSNKASGPATALK